MLPVWSRSPTFARGPRTTTSGPVVTMPHTMLTCAAAADGGVFQVQEIIISRQAPVRMCVWYSVCVCVCVCGFFCCFFLVMFLGAMQIS